MIRETTGDEMKIATIMINSILLVSLSVGVTSIFAGHPNWVEVQVSDRYSAQMLPGVAVCLGTASAPDQFGAVRTDENGKARFDDLIRTALTLTVSKRGYMGNQRQLELHAQGRVLELKLATGGGGPNCDAPAPQPQNIAQPTSSLLITSVAIKPAKQQTASPHVLVSVQASAAANQVRISESRDFSGARWVELTTQVAFELSSGSGMKHLYVQIRRHTGVEGASLDVVSEVKKVRYKAG